VIESLTMEQAYRAMHRFVEACWERGGRRTDDLMLFLSYSETRWEPTGDNPLGTGDPASWNDWLDAVRAVAK
jgi:hypothetical protein